MLNGVEGILVLFGLVVDAAVEPDGAVGTSCGWGAVVGDSSGDVIVVVFCKEPEPNRGRCRPAPGGQHEGDRDGYPQDPHASGNPIRQQLAPMLGSERSLRRRCPLVLTSGIACLLSHGASHWPLWRTVGRDTAACALSPSGIESLSSPRSPLWTFSETVHERDRGQSP